jgi:hypothetical protein
MIFNLILTQGRAAKSISISLPELEWILTKAAFHLQL